MMAALDWGVPKIASPIRQQGVLAAGGHPQIDLRIATGEAP
jgi:hypothetical protein